MNKVEEVGVFSGKWFRYIVQYQGQSPLMFGILSSTDVEAVKESLRPGGCRIAVQELFKLKKPNPSVS